MGIIDRLSKESFCDPRWHSFTELFRGWYAASSGVKRLHCIMSDIDLEIFATRCSQLRASELGWDCSEQRHSNAGRATGSLYSNARISSCMMDERRAMRKCCSRMDMERLQWRQAWTACWENSISMWNVKVLWTVSRPDDQTSADVFMKQSTSQMIRLHRNLWSGRIKDLNLLRWGSNIS